MAYGLIRLGTGVSGPHGEPQTPTDYTAWEYEIPGPKRRHVDAGGDLDGERGITFEAAPAGR